MNHISEVLKILEGALKRNVPLSVSYARLLAQKLQDEGHEQQARLVQRKLDSQRDDLLSLNDGQVAVLPVDQESTLDLATEEPVPADVPSVLLDAHIRREVDRFLDDVGHRDKLLAAGVDIHPRMLIYGPPGVGKTQLARYIAAKLGLPLVTARCDTLISSFLGNTARNVRKLFDHAASRPCALFLDEFDALAKARDDANELGELKRVVVSLLQNVDALPIDTVLLAATNHEQLLDPAVWRRFSARLQIHLPNSELREALIREYLGKFAPAQSLVSAVDLSAGLNGAVIRQSVEACVRDAVISDEKSVALPTLLARFCENILVARSESPSPDSIAMELMRHGIALRAIASATKLSMRKLSNISAQVNRAYENKGSIDNGSQHRKSNPKRAS